VKKRIFITQALHDRLPKTEEQLVELEQVVRSAQLSLFADMTEAGVRIPNFEKALRIYFKKLKTSETSAPSMSFDAGDYIVLIGLKDYPEGLTLNFVLGEKNEPWDFMDFVPQLVTLADFEVDPVTGTSNAKLSLVFANQRVGEPNAKNSNGKTH
jgi:hypothetical protein